MTDGATESREDIVNSTANGKTTPTFTACTNRQAIEKPFCSLIQLLQGILIIISFS